MKAYVLPFLIVVLVTVFNTACGTSVIETSNEVATSEMALDVSLETTEEGRIYVRTALKTDPLTFIELVEGERLVLRNDSNEHELDTFYSFYDGLFFYDYAYVKTIDGDVSKGATYHIDLLRDGNGDDSNASYISLPQAPNLTLPAGDKYTLGESVFINWAIDADTTANDITLNFYALCAISLDEDDAIIYPLLEVGTGGRQPSSQYTTVADSGSIELTSEMIDFIISHSMENSGDFEGSNIPEYCRIVTRLERITVGYVDPLFSETSQFLARQERNIIFYIDVSNP